MPLEEKPKTLPAPSIYVERTLAIIKPDAVHKSDEIEEIILQHGFTILQVCRCLFMFFFSSFPYLEVHSSSILYELRVATSRFWFKSNE